MNWTPQQAAVTAAHAAGARAVNRSCWLFMHLGLGIATVACGSTAPQETTGVVGKALTDPLAQTSARDRAAIAELARVVGLQSIDRIQEPSKATLPSEYCCSAYEQPTSLGPSTTMHRLATIVRVENTNYDGIKPSTWFEREGWKASPALVYEFVYHHITVEGQQLDVQVSGKSPLSFDETARLLSAMAESTVERSGKGDLVYSIQSIKQVTGISRPITVARELLPDISDHEADGHSLAEVHFTYNSLSGRVVVVCLEAGGVELIGSLNSYRFEGARQGSSEQ